ncbi:MAG: hypothetical protein IPH10_08720 [bacterium]|nr:hypothetical protein [bacterium]
MTASEQQHFCMDRRVGCLLLPYGLHTLSDAELTRFEEHLLRCHACQEEIWAAAPYLNVLYLQRLMLVEHFHAAGRSFEECMAHLQMAAVEHSR